MTRDPLYALPLLLLLVGCQPRGNGGGGGSDDDDSGADDDDDDSGADDDDDATSANVDVVIETTLGIFEVEVLVEEAPITANNFLAYVDAGFFDGSDGQGATIFHRVLSGFVVQGGGFTEEIVAKITFAPIENEALASGLSNERGSLSMARTDDPDSATSQFFLNLANNTNLDPIEGNEGYAVFARVTSGMDVVDAIGTTPVDLADQPVVDVVMERVERL